MDGLSAAASVIAVVDLASKVSKLCYEYCTEVKGAKDDIKHLLEEIDSFKVVLESGRDRLEGAQLHPDGSKLDDALTRAHSQLEKLQARLQDNLDGGKRQKAMRRLGIRALKWPFESKGINSIIAQLKTCQDTLSAALAIDSNAKVTSVRQDQLLSRLPIAINAEFNSHANEHEDLCHPKTRVDLLKDIMGWVQNPQSKPIFWLNGAAGTGKSTISRTIVQSLVKEGKLGANFFFKRGEQDRGNATRLFTTLTSQLVSKEPSLAEHVNHALEADRDLPNRPLKDQFEQLILEPLGKLEVQPGAVKTLVLVLDALDECDSEDTVRRIINLLSRTKTLKSPVWLRAFVTSRPELPIRLGFDDVRGEYQDLILHNVPQPVITHDLSVFLDYKLEKISREYNSICHEEHRLPVHWPGEDIILALVERSIPLFISAATICRFIEDRTYGDPGGQLSKVMDYQPGGQQSEIGNLEATYRPVLDQMLIGKSGQQKRSLEEQFRSVVGPIVLLAEPLSVPSLGKLLSIDTRVIDGKLNTLRSVLDVPTSREYPVRPFHLSFRDFLVDPDRRGSDPLWIDERQTHQKIASRCLELLCSSGYLKKDICGLGHPGSSRAEVDPSVIDSCLPAPIRYACLYWVYHLDQSCTRIDDSHPAHGFLRLYFLHWLEALSCFGKMPESASMINTLQALVSKTNNTKIIDFLNDAERFVLYFRSAVDEYPLQLYASGLVFAPENSIIRKTFGTDYMPKWISPLPEVDMEWSDCRQTLYGHSKEIMGLAFSPDGTTLASASDDNTIRLWDLATGREKQIIDLPGWLSPVGFSPDGSTVAIKVLRELQLWDMVTGEKIQTFGDLSSDIISFSSDGQMVAFSSETYSADSISSASDAGNTIQILDVKSGQKVRTVNVGERVRAIFLSSDGVTVTSVSESGILQDWNTESGQELRSVEYGTGEEIYSAVISPTGKTVALVFEDETARLYNTAMNREILWELNNCDIDVDPAFSSDGKTVALLLQNDEVQILDVGSGQTLHVANVNIGANRAIAIALHGKTLAIGGFELRLWNVPKPSKATQTPSSKSLLREVKWAVFSGDGKKAALLSDNALELWDTTSGEQIQLQLHDDIHRDEINILFSPGSKFMAVESRVWLDHESGRDERQLELVDASSGQTTHLFKDVARGPHAFSHGCQTFAVGMSGGVIQLWNLAKEQEMLRLAEPDNKVYRVFFSPDDKTVASISTPPSSHYQHSMGDQRYIQLWDTVSGKKLWQFQHNFSRSSFGRSLAFSPDGKKMASFDISEPIAILDAVGGREICRLGDHGRVLAVAFSPDGKSIACSSLIESTQIWDVTDCKKIQKKINVMEKPRRLSFSSYQQFLKTDLGLIRLSSKPATAESHEDECTADGTWFKDNAWMKCDGKRALWLPADYRDVVLAFYDPTPAWRFNKGFQIVRFKRIDEK